jgi:hypothetical protein
MQTGSSLGLVLGLIFAVLLLAALASVAFFVLRKRNLQEKRKSILSGDLSAFGGTVYFQGENCDSSIL